VTKTCPMCDGLGGWTDYVAQSSIVCPLCRVRDEVEPREAREMPTWIGFPRRRQPNFGPKLQTRPWLLVIHSGDGPGNVAAFLADIGEQRKADGTRTPVSAHFAWDNTTGKFAQGVALDHVAWHSGGSVMYSDRLKRVVPSYSGPDFKRTNFCSYGIEMHGPYSRKYEQADYSALGALVLALRTEMPTLAVVAAHSAINPRKKDPGKQFDMDCFLEWGLKVYC